MSYELIIYVVHNSKGPTAATCQKHLKPRHKTLRVIRQRVSGRCSEAIIEAKIYFCATFKNFLTKLLFQDGLIWLVKQNANHSNRIKANRAWPWYLALCFSVLLTWAGGARPVTPGQVGRCQAALISRPLCCRLHESEIIWMLMGDRHMWEAHMHQQQRSALCDRRHLSMLIFALEQNK